MEHKFARNMSFFQVDPNKKGVPDRKTFHIPEILIVISRSKADAQNAMSYQCYSLGHSRESYLHFAEVLFSIKIFDKLFKRSETV